MFLCDIVIERREGGALISGISIQFHYHVLTTIHITDVSSPNEDVDKPVNDEVFLTRDKPT